MEQVYLHFPILQVLIPLLLAPICVLVGRSTFSWLITFFGSVSSLVIAISLLHSVSDGSSISYHIGGWPPPIGIEYVVDSANAFLLVLVSGISTVVLLYARDQIKLEIDEENHTLFYTCYLLCLTGLLGVLITGDVFNVFVFLEISSLSTYVLVAQGAKRDKRALKAAFNYLIMGTVGATFFVIGVGFIYMATGTLNMFDIYERINDLESSRTVRASYAFIVIGMGLKLAMFPMHLWMPGAYTYAPTVVTTFLSATATKVSLYVLIRFTFSVFHFDFNFIEQVFKFLVMPLAIIAMFAMSFVAIFQKDIKRMLAYSSIAQIGYMLLGVSLLSSEGLTATFVNLFNHGITKATLFMSLGVLTLYSGKSFLSDVQGLGKKMPWISASFLIGGLSLVGIPGTAGFISKWLLVQATIEAGVPILALLIILSSLLAIVYIWKVIEHLYFMEPHSELASQKVSFRILIPLWILSISCLYWGFDTSLTVGTSDIAANNLFNNVIKLN
ncbi:MAG: monovalent cation/H+ antiporter subunit D family protein [Paracoccaceae bacterium]|nr:monovalent cation/H+ antiporter subunit D family protein [Paracoccaceae bacterium]